MIGFITGLMTGGIFGVMTMAIFIVGKRSDDNM